MLNTSSRPGLWFKCLQPMPGARRRLFIFPCAGASAFSYRQWTADPADDVEAFALQLPGRSDRLREQPVTDIESLIGDVADVVLKLADRPFLFFGHSLGALLAFETARELRRRASACLPAHLFAAACAAPQMSHTDRQLRGLPDLELLARLVALGGTPDELAAEPDLMDLVLPAMRADLLLHENYRYTAELPLACPITVLGGLGDETVSEEELNAWRAGTAAAFRSRMFAGGHFFVHAERSGIMRLMFEKI
jgi:medium-chain acyl-[acyl-carrier-protein] hydrolase